MINDDLNFKILLFNFQKQEIKDSINHKIFLQSEFTDDFKIGQIESLSLNQYVLGLRTNDSFCYRLETGLISIGNMKGSRAPKFGVYFGKNGKDTERKYRFTKKYGVDLDAAFLSIKSHISELLNFGLVDDRLGIINNKIAPVFKYKLLGTYYPDKYLNFYSIEHVDFFISELGLNNTSPNMYDKLKILLNFKEDHMIAKSWNNYEFNDFLYKTFGRPSSKEKELFEKGILPPIEKVEAQEIELTILTPDISDKYANGLKKIKRNYLEQYEKNNKLGKRGENIIFNHEKKKLALKNLPVNNLRMISEEDDSLGYDILSLMDDESPKYIEVKSTTSKIGNVNFFISSNELKKSKTLKNYFIYIVFEAHTLRPKIWQIEEPFKKHINDIVLIPVNYKAQIKIEK